MDEPAAYTTPQDSLTTHSLTVQGRKIDYTAHAGWTVLRKDDEPVAEMFSVAYITQDEGPRPLTFVFNGGPGASSAYLHLGAIGPRIAEFSDTGEALAPPARRVNNPVSWLGFTDLVFIDPVGTGFSRIIPEDKRGGSEAAKGPEKKEPKVKKDEYFGIERDLESFGEFIRTFLTAHKRWESPIYVAGESYGGYRVARLVRVLQEKYGVGLAGAIILSPALDFNFLNLYPSDYDVLPWAEVLPTMAIAAAIHGKSRRFDPETDTEEILAEIEAFALGDYLTYLAAGDNLDERIRSRTAAKLAAYLGLPKDAIVTAAGRITIGTFARMLLKDEGRTLGLYDASVTVVDPYPDRDSFEGPDPTLAGIERVFAAAANAHIRDDLGVASERDYHLLARDVNEQWKEDGKNHVLQRPKGSVDDLRYGMVLNPHMKVFLCHGLYDLVTPFFASERLAGLLKLPKNIQENLTVRHYPGGHMFYLRKSSREGLYGQVREFYTGRRR